jgi:SAM-dependent methyltransferase
LPYSAAVSSGQGAFTFQVAGDSYDRFMGRYSRPLAVVFADAAGVRSGQRVLDVGCGPGALTEELVRRLGADSVEAIDPSQPFVEECARRNPGVDVRLGSAEALPYADDSFEAALAQLVFHFVSDPETAAGELLRVLRPGGTAAACVWDFAGSMTMLRHFWEAARAVVPEAPSEQQLRFGRDGELADLFTGAGFGEVESGSVAVEVGYESFDDLWSGFLIGAGPSGAFCVSLDAATQEAVREEFRRRLGDPPGAFTLGGRAWYATGRA